MPLRFVDIKGAAPDDWFYWMSAEGKLMKWEERNGINNVYLMNFDEKNTANNKYVAIDQFNAKSKGNNFLMIAVVGDLLNTAGGEGLVKRFGFSPNFHEPNTVAYSVQNSGSVILNTVGHQPTHLVFN